MIELRDISKLYPTSRGPVTVLDRISASFPARASVGILGHNGAGKSTLLRVIAGIETPDCGQIERAGTVSWPIGFSGGFNGSLTGEENCRFVARIYGQDVDHVVDATREFAAIGMYFYEPVRTYSSGMRARVAFGLSMAIDFDVYLVDEVIAAGDSRFQKLCQNEFEKRRERSSVIMVSHQLARLRQYCTMGAVLCNGKLRVFDDLKDAEKAYEAAAAVAR